MEKYDSYRPSGIQWMTEIPSHWEVSKVRTHFRPRTDKVSEKDFAPLSVSKMGIVPQLEDVAISQQEGNTRKLVRKGDFVVNSRSDRKGSCGVSPLDGSVSLINIVLEPHNIEHQYVHYLFRMNDWIEDFYRYGRGIVADLWTTNYQQMKNMLMPVPPLPEQKAIVDYLDRETQKIDSLIAAKEKELALLDELKQAEIANAVTHGLNPDAPMKPSGISWLGDIPTHWEVNRVKVIANSISKGNGITKDMVYPDGDTPCVRYGEIYSKYSHSFTNALSKTNLAEITSPRFISYGDALCAGTGELVDEIGKSIVYLGKEACLAGGDIVVISHSQDPAFFNYAFNSNYAQLQKSIGKSKLKVVHISGSELGNVRLALPPISEQKAIVDYLDHRCATLKELSSNVEQEIAHLKEYKQRLIADAVTGQIKVC